MIMSQRTFNFASLTAVMMTFSVGFFTSLVIFSFAIAKILFRENKQKQSGIP